MVLLNISIIIKILFVFFALFVLLPGRLFKPAQDDSFLDTFFINLTHMVFIAILLVPFLVIIKMYDLFSLSLSFFLIFLSPNIYNLCKHRSLVEIKKELRHRETVMTTYLLDVLDRRVSPLVQFGRYLIRRFVILRERLRNPDRTTILYILLWTAVFGYAAYLRLYDPFIHLTPGLSDPYPIIKNVKNLEMNRLFPEHIYPEGFSSILSVFHFLSFLDLAHILRLFGPLMALVLVLSVYYVTLKATSNKWAALIPAFIYGAFTNNNQLPIELGRQITTLNQEFAMVFLLPTLYFLLQYLITRQKRYLFLFFEGLVIIFKVHSIVAVMAFWGMVAIFITGLFNRLWDRQVFLKVLGAGALATFLGHLTLLIGLMTGYRFHGSSAAMITLFAPQHTSPYLSLSPLLWVISFLAFFVLIFSLFFCHSKEKRIAYLFPCIFYLLLVLEYQANYFHIRHLVARYRTGQFVALTAAVIAGVSFHLFTLKDVVKKPLFHKVFYPAITLGTLLALGTAFPAKPPVSFRMGYEAAMANYLRISKEYTPLQWLIVSQVEEYSLALNKGWHMNTANFLERYSPFEEELPIDTPHIFIFVEKEIFKITVERTQEDYDWRWDQMRRMEEWCRIYMSNHKNMNIFYNDEKFEVYAIHKEKGLKPIIPFKEGRE